MMTSTGSHRGLLWAVVGGVVLVAGIAVLVAAAISGNAGPTPTSSQSESPRPSTSASPNSTGAGDAYVDPTAAERGWVPEPITTDEDIYIRAALAAASTFDTQRSTREEWLAYLEGWFTPDVRYTSDADREAVMASAKVELREGVVLPEQDWDALAEQDGRVSAAVSGPISTMPVPDDPSGDMTIATADVTLTFTQADGNGGESSFDEPVRVSVQVLCGEGSVPAPGTDQRAGDCKVVRYFTEPLEP